MIIGQDKIIKYIDAQTKDSFPHSFMLCGKLGSGKHLIANYVATHLQLPLIDITNDLSQEFIDELYINPKSNVYLIDLDKLSYNAQNSILKLVEEPLESMFIVLIVKNTQWVLETIVNRCNVQRLEEYSKEILKQFNEDESLYNIFDTPGQLLSINTLDINYYQVLSNKIITMIDKANFPNTLTLIDKFSFDEDDTKCSIEIFGKILLNECKKIYKETVKENIFDAYLLTKEFNSDLLIPNIDKKILFNNYLIKLRNIMRGE